MKNLKLLVIGAVGVFAVAGCGAVGPLPGTIYTNAKYPSIASQSGPGPKTGTAQARSYLGMVAVGDASVATACKNGGISDIHTVDTTATTILGVYSTWTTTVTGR